ncbi:patatin-like phospholipase family protein, partial [Synechococcus sp. MU1644]|nr:patatin-like phospholipase family protein [Synechococcus sp. MU1644]
MTRKKINVALQGGGAHGAFTWGALDVLLADDRIEVAGISGTSAGALNGAAVKAGLAIGGEDDARENLDWLWGQVAGVQDMRMAQWMAPFGPAQVSQALENSIPYAVGDAVGRMLSPYLYGPFYRNPLTDIVSKFNMEKVCCDDGPQLFINATRVRNGKLRVFKQAEVTPDAIMASACLPQLYRAVEIDGVPYWDGGYMGNPALFPLYGKTGTDDIVVVQINPIERKGVPRSAQEIENRLNEISFNASLLKELRAIDFVDRLIAQGKLSTDHYRPVKVHLIENEDALKPMGASSKMNVEWAFLTRLRDIGRETAATWLDTFHDRIGVDSTVDLRAMFQG